MEHLALYRKYRPRSFQEVIGQEHITKALANQIASGKIGHAYLFTGARGIGKTSVARILARAVNCENNKQGSPCGQCPTCKRLESENDINIIEIDAASNNRVDDIREIREKVKFTPVGAKYKVYIIDEVHMLTDSAFNALLKTLEEPPAYVIFVLATTEAHKLPATILSRCIRFDFRLVSTEKLTSLLQNIFDRENIPYDNDALRLIASAGEGSVRDTLSIADSVVAYNENKITCESVQSVLGTTDYDLLINFFDILRDKNIGSLLEFVNEIDNSKNLSVFVKELSKQARNLLVIKSCTKPNEILNLPEEAFQKLSEQAKNFDEKTLIRYMQTFGGAENELRYTLLPRLLLETLALGLLEDLPSEDVKKKLKSQAYTGTLSAKNIWGKLVLYLKERRQIALQVACGDITDVELKENKLIINISDGMIYNLLSEGKRELENALKWQGLDLEIDINVKKEELSTQEKDIEKLKDLFGENLVIKGGK